MKASIGVFLFVGIFFTIVSVIYGVWSQMSELAGFTACVLSAAMGFMVAFYLYVTSKKTGLGPDDDLQGEIDQIQGDYGFFPPHSWTPLYIAFAAALLFVGIAAGWWIFAIGVFLGIPALIAWTFEYWRGEHSL